VGPVPKSSVIPPGGYHFITATPEGGTLKIESHSVESVQELLLKYRLNNNLPVGNPQQEVIDYICGTWPHFCTETTEAFLVPAMSITREAHLSRRVSDWTARLWALGSDNAVAQPEADRRAAICSSCPQNKDYRPGACAPCVESLDRLSFIWLRNRSTPFDQSLGGCRACGANLKTAVQASRLPPLSDADKNSLDPSCWRK
jgi:hypothetical protein